MKRQLKAINTNVNIIGFNKDKSISINDLKYLHKFIKNSKLHIFDGDHFGYFDHLNEIALLIGETYDSF